MVYYTERNGMRKPIERTYDISTDKYALLLDCCEKYYNNLAWKFPEQCPDGRGCCGLDASQFSAHKLRHTAATLMLANGVDLKTLQEVLGHENLNTTQIYTHIENTDKKIAAEANPLSKLKL